MTTYISNSKTYGHELSDTPSDRYSSEITFMSTYRCRIDSSKMMANLAKTIDGKSWFVFADGNAIDAESI